MSYLLKERNTCGKFNNIGCQASFHYLSELDRRDRRLGAETSYINFCALFNVICSCNVLATVRSQALAFTGQPFSGSSGAGQWPGWGHSPWRVWSLCCGARTVSSSSARARSCAGAASSSAASPPSPTTSPAPTPSCLPPHTSTRRRGCRSTSGALESRRVISSCCCKYSGNKCFDILFVAGKTLLFHKITRMLCP